MSQLISCQLHDYVEIACLYHYRVRVILKKGEIVEGKAMDTFVDQKKYEYLILENSQRRLLELNQLKQLIVLSSNPVFNAIDF